MGSELPLITRILIAISNFFVNWWPVVFGAIALLIILYKLWRKTPGGALTMGRVSLKIPIIGKIGTMNAASQFANTLCVLLTAGLPITQVITIIARIMDNAAVAKTLSEAIVELESGKRLGKTLEDNPYLPEMLIEMVSVGEETGALEETMDTIGSYYDEEAEVASARALSMLEPMMTVFLGVLVGFIVLAIYIPMFSMETMVG